MNFSCDQCQRRYSLPDDRLVGKSVKVRCKNCQFMMTVGPVEPLLASPRRSIPAAAPRVAATPAPLEAASPAPWEREPTRAQPETDSPAQWFAMIHGKQEGPLGAGALPARVRSGQLTPRTYVWKNGMADWRRAADVPELAPVFSSRPPPKTAPAPTPAPVRPTQSRPAPSLFDEEMEPAEERTVVSHPADAPPGPRAPAAAASGSRAAAASKVDLGTLFSDVGDPDDAEKTAVLSAKAVNRKASSRAAPPEDDPFAMLPGMDPDNVAPVGEATSFFIAQAGMHKRNPPWKIALFVGGGIALPVLLYLVLSSLNVVPAEIHHVDASGNQVASKVFSSDGISALGRMLMGGQKAKPSSALSRRRTLASGVTLPKDHPLGAGADGPRGGSAGAAMLDTSTVALARGKGAPQMNRDLQKIYGDSAKTDVGPGLNRLAQREAEPARDASGGPPPEAISKVVGQNQLAFQFCIEQQLKKNPHFKGGKISLIATVAASGIVKRTQIDRHDIDASDLGDCLKVKAKRMTFPPFSGDEVDLEIPLILTTAM